MDEALSPLRHQPANEAFPAPVLALVPVPDAGSRPRTFEAPTSALTWGLTGCRRLGTYHAMARLTPFRRPDLAQEVTPWHRVVPSQRPRGSIP
jgi:hypothetical protein